MQPRSRVRVGFSTALVICLCMVGTVVGDIPAQADNTTISYDLLRTGWDPNEPKLSSSDVTAADFGQLFGTQLDGQIYAQPVVAKSVVMAVTENNKAYGLDPVSGAIKWTRDVGPPWKAGYLGCGDLVPNVGITATPVVDPGSGTAYFTAKVDDGINNPNWYVHAVDITTGAERAGFPTRIAGSPTNNPTNTFQPRTAMQRPGLLLLDGVVYAAFASHCDIAPYVGYVIGFDATTGEQTTMWSTETGSSTAAAGIWHSGGGLVSDGPKRIIFTTGNGISPAPGPGTSPPGTLGESVVRLQVNSDRSLVSKDFFSPVNNTNLDRDDSDLGSGAPMAIPNGFGTAAHPHLLVQVGKDGRVFLLDRDNLGGTGQGSGGGDAVLQTGGPYNGVWGKPAFWGGDGGYVYLIHNGGPLSAFKVGVSGTGQPSLTRTGTSTGLWGYTSGSPVITSNGTASGSALVWGIYSSDATGANGQLRAYEAVPKNGTLALKYSAPIGKAMKFAVPATENGRVYVGTRDGVLFGFGRPTTVSLSGSPTDFGLVPVGTTSTKTVTVTALRPVTVTRVGATGDGFASGAVAVPKTLAVGETLSVPVSFTPGTATSLSGALSFTTSAGNLGFDLHGSGAKDGLLATPGNLAFGDVPTQGVVTYSVSISNTGTTDTTITAVTLPADSFVVASPPAVGSVLSPGESVSVPIAFSPASTGAVNSQLVVSSSTGDVSVPLSGTGVAGSAKLTITPTDVDFGTVQVGETVTKAFDISNTGNLVLTLTKAAPPAAPFNVTAPISEGQQLEPADTFRQEVSFTPTTSGEVSGTYAITSNDGSGAQNVRVHGIGASGSSGRVIGAGSKCLDVRGANPANGTAVQLWSCNGTNAQTWSAPGDKTLRALGKCLDVVGGSTANGAQVQLYSCNGTGAQAWVPLGDGSVQNPQSHRCLDIPAGNASDGVQLQIWDCNGTAAQRWTVPTKGTVTGSVVGLGGKCLDVRGASPADGTAVQLWGCNGTNAQLWSVSTDRTLRVLGKCLEVVGGGTANGSKVQLYSCNGTGAQKWVPLGDGTLGNPQSSRCLDVPGAIAADGTQLQIWDCNGTAAQRWQVPA